ncbi:tumor necrosis factor ligand superfamily member 11 [Xiphophorus maculatus]|uniref:TNF superfamily member 11 n=1 Tax=Xiphophorus maculatus TaxID=8083 RepID=M3ZDN5_XIPMA|nr:tumor necrosis factor ligand superfamily member 11 [Xiphophorus maculatus]
MAATHSSEYRAYLRNAMDVEAGQQRFPPVPSSEPTYRSLFIGTLAVMGILQVASSVAILLHLTGYLHEVDLSPSSRPSLEMESEPVVHALKDPRKKVRCKPPKDATTPSAHLPIRAPQEFTKKDYSMINIKWDDLHGNLHKMSYDDGNLLVRESGLYYVYVKTCFRYYNIGGPDEGREARTRPPDVSKAQLIQYVYHKSIKQNSRKVLLMKTGSTKQWNNTSYNMYCAQQSRVVPLVEGDALFVEVSNAWLLDQEAEGTYFGAVKWGN